MYRVELCCVVHSVALASVLSVTTYARLQVIASELLKRQREIEQAIAEKSAFEQRIQDLEVALRVSVRTCST